MQVTFVEGEVESYGLLGSEVDHETLTPCAGASFHIGAKMSGRTQAGQRQVRDRS